MGYKWGRKKKGIYVRYISQEDRRRSSFFEQKLRNIGKEQCKKNGYGEGRRKIGFEFLTRKKI